MSYYVSGIYIERDRAVLTRATAQRIHHDSPWGINFLGHATTKWNPTDKTQAMRSIVELIAFACQQNYRLDSLALGAYGPFLSLISSDREDYAKVHPKSAHLPFRGADYLQLFRDGVAEAGHQSPPHFSIHTDASACAIGEAMTRGLGLQRVIGSVVVGKGIGLGLVQKYRSIASPLHPEIGLLPMATSRKDKLRHPSNRPRSLAEMAANDAMCRRANIALTDGDDHPEKLYSVKDEALWDLRAEYIAQACLAFSAVYPPNVISLHPYIDPLGDLGERTLYHFRRLLKFLRISGQPVFKYSGLSAVDFISSSKQTHALEGTTAIASTGAMGLCYAAADRAFEATRISM